MCEVISKSVHVCWIYGAGTLYYMAIQYTNIQQSSNHFKRLWPFEQMSDCLYETSFSCEEQGCTAISGSAHICSSYKADTKLLIDQCSHTYRQAQTYKSLPVFTTLIRDLKQTTKSHTRTHGLTSDTCLVLLCI